MKKSWILLTACAALLSGVEAIASLTPFSATKFAGIPHSTLLGHIFGRVFALTPPDGVIFFAIYVN